MVIVPRREWAGDIPPKATARAIDLPALELYLHHGATGISSIATARSYVRYHIQTRGWIDVGYHFLIAEGRVLEGRGAGHQGAQVANRNSVSQGICLVGNYQSSPLADRDLDALVWLLRHGHVQGWWSTAALTGGHRDAPGASTGCPGDGAYRLIPTINHRAQEDDDMTPQQAKMLEAVYRELTDRERHTVARKTFATNDALGAFLKGGAEVNVDVDELAAALSETLGDDVAQAVGRKLVG